MDKLLNKTKFTVHDIVSKNEKRKDTKSLTKELFIEKCRKKIESYNKFGKEDILFEISDFIIGIPPYNPFEITKYVCEYLIEAGFYVYKLPKMNIIYISWKKNDIQKITNQKNGYLTISLNDTGFFDNLPINTKALNKKQ